MSFKKSKDNNDTEIHKDCGVVGPLFNDIFKKKIKYYDDKNKDAIKKVLGEDYKTATAKKTKKFLCCIIL